ncbi:hypothetical protein ATO6_15440 [Oceanicola sp. 22II-s10i]|uniref:hypothetical protein n=1 Tax=Oceanicola sp. 22II-s10i TaxID=1317116 RepID=UPI000B522118|nr:hypothetical protein [Oceanicola sp. 22II-s10i]OWU83821.1 hypothetical protein ATO6_15440 [Oceanicola sp. 22II-s10i]
MKRPYDGPAIRALFRQLVEDFGGVEAAASFLRCTKGTISKEMAGHMQIPVEHWAALEDELEHWPITGLLHGRREGRGAQGEVEALAARVIAENGDVANAVLRHLTAGDRSGLIKELTEAIAAEQRFLAHLQAEGASD